MAESICGEDDQTRSQNDLDEWEGIFDLESKRNELRSLEERMAEAGFWNDRQEAERVSRQSP